MRKIKICKCSHQPTAFYYPADGELCWGQGEHVFWSGQATVEGIVSARELLCVNTAPCSSDALRL